MATTLTGTVKITCQPNQQKTLDLSTPKDIVDSAGVLSWAITSGVTADKADLVWHDQRTITPSADDDIDLTGTLENAFGDTVTFARLKAIFIKTSAGTTANLYLGGPVANALATLFGDVSDRIIVRGGAGGLLIMAPDATGYVVTESTADQLRISHDGSTSDDAVYDIILIGASA